MLGIEACDPDERNQQFEDINAERERHRPLGSAILSVDTKKKESLGGLHRTGQLYSQGEALKRYDHAFPYLASGKIIPHGIYDLQTNCAFVTLGNSRETPQFIGASLTGGIIVAASTMLTLIGSSRFSIVEVPTLTVATNSNWKC